MRLGKRKTGKKERLPCYVMLNGWKKSMFGEITSAAFEFPSRGTPLCPLLESHNENTGRTFFPPVKNPLISLLCGTVLLKLLGVAGRC